MDASVRAAMEKWPSVPAVHRWLSLDRNGRWQLRGEPITHPGLIAFINRNYECDDAGRWFFQNGPQRGFVRLEYTPWVLHVDQAGRLYTHTGREVDSVSGAWLDDEGNLLLAIPDGVGLVAGDALARVSEWLVGPDGGPAEPDSIEAVTDCTDGPAVWLSFRGLRVPLERITRDRVPGYFGFVADPQPDEYGDRP